jgi:hypothetical protein
VLCHLIHPQYVHKIPYSFTLADGIAPFHVLGVIAVSIQFDNLTTSIHAHIARQLCADMIIGMDYINKYNLNINVIQQSISITYHNRILTMKMDTDFEVHKIPVTSSQLIYVPPHTNRMTNVSIPISSIHSSFVPNSSLKCNPSLIITHTHLNFRNYSSNVMFSNLSSIPQFINKGTCIGFLVCGYTSQGSQTSPKFLRKSFGVTEYSGLTPANFDCDTDAFTNYQPPFGVTGFSDATPVFCGFDIDQRIKEQKSFEVTGSSGKTPVFHDSHTDKIAYYTTPKYPHNNVSCNTVSPLATAVKENLRMLVQKIENSQQKDQLFSLLAHFHSTFDVTRHNIANTPINHVINTIPHSPPACRPYPQPDRDEAMYKLIQEFLQADLIQESHSPYAAPAMLVKKKDSSYRFVVDYKKLNLITIKDSSPLPNMEDTIRKLGQGYSYFSKLDLKSGFYQIPINDLDKEKTAFITPFGLYQFNVLPMGLKNSPPTFQKVMTSTLQSCRQFSLVYLDDIIIFSKSYSEHLYHLERVLSALQAKRLVLNPPKCELAVREIDYLGHTISQYRVTPMKEKITAILQIAEPRSLSQANKFIGGLGWYRKFLPNFATIAAPIHTVTNLTKSNRRKFRWGFAQSKAFQELKHALTTKPLFLHYPVDNTPVILTTDASGIGVGGVLQQEVNGEIHNLYYHSQLMTQCERKYSTIEKEALAIYKCFERMRPFLLGRNIILMTDHCPLCHIMEKTVNNARVDRITHLIQEYNIDKVIHIKGRENCLPDFLSRYSREQDDDLFEIDYGIGSKDLSSTPTSSSTHIDSDSFSPFAHNNTSTLAAMTLRPRQNKQTPVSATTYVDDDVIINNNSDAGHSKDISKNKRLPANFSHNYFDITKLKEEQQQDPQIQQVVQQLKSKSNNLPFTFKNNILYKLIKPSHKQGTKKTRSNLLTLFHGSAITSGLP